MGGCMTLTSMTANIEWAREGLAPLTIYTLVYTRDSRVATQGGHATYCRVDRDTCQTDHPLPSAYLMCWSGLSFTLMFQY